MKTDAQLTSICKHLQTKGFITPLEALKKFGCFRLAARIFDLRDKGFIIETKIVEEKGGKRYAKYVYKGR
jgi:ribosomal protein S8